MVLREAMSLHSLWWSTMVASQGIGAAAAYRQILLAPENTWVSWGALVAIVTLAVVSTWKVAKFVEGVNGRLATIEKKLDEIQGDDKKS